MIEHVIGNHRVEGFIFKGNGLRIDLLKLEGAPCHDQVTPCGVQHPGRKITKCEGPSSRDSSYVLSPQQTMTTAQFEDPGILRQLEESIENPFEPAVGI